MKRYKIVLIILLKFQTEQQLSISYSLILLTRCVAMRISSLEMFLLNSSDHSFKSELVSTLVGEEDSDEDMTAYLQLLTKLLAVS